MLKGYRTYLAIVLSLLGSFGAFEKLGVTQEDVAQTVDLGLTFVAGVVALYLNWKNHQEMK